MDDLSPVADVLVPVGALLTVVTGVGTVHWLKGKRRLALLAPLSVVSVLGVVGTARVARPDSPWARWRYDGTRAAQALARFGGHPPRPVHRLVPPATAGFGLVLAGVLAGVPLGAATSPVGGVLVGHALLASAGRPASRRVCAVLAATAAAGQVAVLVLDPADARVWPAAAAVLAVAAGAAVLHRGGTAVTARPAAGRTGGAR